LSTHFHIFTVSADAADVIAPSMIRKKILLAHGRPVDELITA
jgi:hypothetical protein